MMKPRQLTGNCTEQVDELRIAARRAREQERLKKLGPGRLRSIGVSMLENYFFLTFFMVL